MTVTIDPTHPVLVTGATGYVAGEIVRRLLDAGCTVHAAVRDPSNRDKIDPLDALAADAPGAIRYFASNLLEPGTYAEAMAGCRVVLHTASPVISQTDDPLRDLVEPALHGVRNVLGQANETPSVERVVLTSSTAAIWGDCTDRKDTPRGVFDETVWNTTSTLDHKPYHYAKTLAEREAWRIAEGQDRWRLVAVNPCLVLGPAVNPHAPAESIELMRAFGDGRLRRGVPDIPMGMVDIRDVAEMHLRAAFDDRAHGRYVTAAHNSRFPAIGDILRAHYGDLYPFPRRVLPTWLVWLIGPMIDRRITRRMVARNFGRDWIGDNTKSRAELDMTYRPLEESVLDMFQQLLDVGEIPSPHA